MNQTPSSIGLIGVGRMGRGLGHNLLKAGFGLVVSDADRQRTKELCALGANEAASTGEVLSRANIVGTCLPTLDAVRNVYLGDDGIVAQAPPGARLIDFTSGAPALTQKIGALLAERGSSLIDAPILLGEAEAWAGTVRLIVGGAQADVDACASILSTVSEAWTHVGPLGHGHAFKAINNSVTMANHVALCEAFVVADTIGLDGQVLLEILGQSQAASRKLAELGPKLASKNHSATIEIEPATKDVHNFSSLARGGGVPTPVADSVHLLLRIAIAQGLGGEGISHLATALDRLRGPSDAGE